MKATRLALAGLGLYFYLTGLLLAAQNTTPTAGTFSLPAKTATRTSSAAPAPSASAGSGPASNAPPSGGAPSPSASSAASVGPVPGVLGGATIHAGYVIAIGTKSGELGNGVIEAIKFQFHPDTSSGTSLGQLTFTKKWDAASLPLLTALSTRETLTVTIDFLATDRTGKQTKAMSIKLNNATVMSVNQFLDPTGALEDVTLNFAQIEMSDPISKASYSWRK